MLCICIQHPKHFVSVSTNFAQEETKITTFFAKEFKLYQIRRTASMSIN